MSDRQYSRHGRFGLDKETLGQPLKREKGPFSSGVSFSCQRREDSGSSGDVGTFPRCPPPICVGRFQAEDRTYSVTNDPATRLGWKLWVRRSGVLLILYTRASSKVTCARFRLHDQVPTLPSVCAGLSRVVLTTRDPVSQPRVYGHKTIKKKRPFLLVVVVATPLFHRSSSFFSLLPLRKLSSLSHSSSPPRATSLRSVSTLPLFHGLRHKGLVLYLFFIWLSIRVRLA